MLVRLTFFVEPAHDPWLYGYAWSAYAINALVLLFNLLYSRIAASGYRPPAGSYCWRSFRVYSSRLSTSEHLLLLGILLVLFVLRRDSFGSLVSMFVSLGMVANASRHVYQSIRAGYTMSMLRSRPDSTTRSRDLPAESASLWWLLFFVIVQLLTNLVFTIPFVWHFVLLPLIWSRRLVVLAIAVCVLAGVLVVDKFSNAELKRRTEIAKPKEEKKESKSN